MDKAWRVAYASCSKESSYLALRSQLFSKLDISEYDAFEPCDYSDTLPVHLLHTLVKNGEMLQLLASWEF